MVLPRILYWLLFGVFLSLVHFYVGLLVLSWFKSSKTPMSKAGFAPFIRDGSLFFYTAATTAVSFGSYICDESRTNLFGSGVLDILALAVLFLLLIYSLVCYATVVFLTLSKYHKVPRSKFVLARSVPAAIIAALYSLGLSLLGSGR